MLLPEGAELLIDAARLNAGFDSLALRVQPLVDADDCVLIGILNGGMYPLVRLADRLQGDFELDYCHVTRYEGKTAGDEIIWQQEPHVDLRARTVIVVDDICDAGVTWQ